MGLRVANGVVLLAAILASSLLASQVQSTTPYNPIREEESESEYEDYGDTPCLNYCSSRLMGTTYCCPTATRPIVDEVYTGHNVRDCSTHIVGCRGVRQNVIGCSTHSVGCHGIPQTVVTRGSLRYPTRVPAPVPVPVPDHQVIMIDNPVVEHRPSYVCQRSDCSPVRTPGSQVRPGWPVCPGPFCRGWPNHREQFPPLISHRMCDFEDLGLAVRNLLNRSYVRAYTMQTFIDGLQTIVDSHWNYSWFGQCVAPRTFDSEVFSGEVDIFTRPGFRRCSTRFQTILGSFDNCYRSRRRVRSLQSRPAQGLPTPRTVQTGLPDIREEVRRLLEQASTFTRRAFLAALEKILRNAKDGRYRWNQTMFISVARTHANSKEQVLPVPTLQPSAKSEVEENTTTLADYAEYA